MINYEEWIPVTEKLPDTHKKCLVVSTRGGFNIAEYRGELEGSYKFNSTHHDVHPVAWMYLPEPYKEKL